MRKITILLLILLMLPVLAIAKEGHMKLLAVKETDNGYTGSTADLYLEIKPGQGRVFLETYPLLKIDTQISTRFAKDIACDYLSLNCDNHDFIYTIKSDAVIIGGPSAGAAITTLTIAMLSNMNIDESISITGTINSGGIVGTVGGIKEKIDAAGQTGIKTVLIPIGERFVKQEPYNQTNQTLNITEKDETTYNQTDLYEYGNELGVNVIEVTSIDDIMQVFAGKKIQQNTAEIVVDNQYKETMKSLAINLCNRTQRLRNMITSGEYDGFNSTFLSAINLSENSKQSFIEQKYYSSASYCFGANVKFSYLILLSENASKEALVGKVGIIRKNIEDLDKALDNKKIKTITDLEAFMVVKERLTEAKNELDSAIKNIAANEMAESFYNLAYSSERTYSAYSWFSFFDNRGNGIDFNKENLEQTCKNKIQEAEERYAYVDYFLPSERENTKQEIALAYEDLKNGDYELCLFKASKSKAESDVILSMMYVEPDKIDDTINHKIGIAKRAVVSQIDKGQFPVLGYSYYEYADTLSSTDKYSALLYSEYALELSNLDFYFKDRKRVYIYDVKTEIIAAFALGIIIGIIIATLFIFGFFKKTKRKRLRNPSRTQKRALLGKKR